MRKLLILVSTSILLGMQGCANYPFKLTPLLYNVPEGSNLPPEEWTCPVPVEHKQVKPNGTERIV